MLGFIRATEFCAAIIVAAIMLTGAPSRSYAEDGSVRLKITNTQTQKS